MLQNHYYFSLDSLFLPPTVSPPPPAGQDLQRDTPTRTILNENPTINLPLINPALLIPLIDHIIRARRFLQNTKLILALSGIIIRHGLGDAAQRLVALGVVDLEGAAISDHCLQSVASRSQMVK